MWWLPLAPTIARLVCVCKCMCVYCSLRSHFCIAIFLISLPLRRQSISMCSPERWVRCVRNGIRVICALLNIFLFEFCFSFVFSLLLPFYSSTLCKSAIEICHAYRLTHSPTDSLCICLGFVSRWNSFHAVFLTEADLLRSVAAIASHKMQKDTRAAHYCLWRRKIMRHATQCKERHRLMKKKDAEARRKMCLLHATRIWSEMCRSTAIQGTGRRRENDWCVKRKIKKRVRIWYCCWTVDLCVNKTESNEIIKGPNVVSCRE